MTGRTRYSQEEINSARFALAEQLSAYATLSAETSGETAEAALADFEPLFFNNLVLVLDRFFVERERSVTGADSNPMNEVGLIAESLMTNNAVLRGDAELSYRPADTVLRLELGDDIRLTAAEFDRLSTAFLAEVETRMGV
jgi:hypothetical protein